jgi:hypothetical protein
MNKNRCGELAEEEFPADSRELQMGYRYAEVEFPLFLGHRIPYVLSLCA